MSKIVNKKKLLIENFLIYGIGQMLYKLVPLIMLPIVTRMLPDTYYMGINDLSSTVVSLVASITLVGMYDAVFRLFFDYEDEEFDKRKVICSTALAIVIILSAAGFIIMFLFRDKLSKLFFDEQGYGYLVIICGLTVIATNVRNIIIAPIRMQNQKKRFIIGNTITPICSYTVSMIMLNMGLYIIALPVGTLTGLLVGIIIFWIWDYKWFDLKLFDKDIVKKLLKIGIPLCPTFIIFWIYSSFDKIMISKMLDVGQTGIFSVGNKLAQVSQLITAAFSAGWSYFNFATMNDEKHAKDFSDIIEFMLIISVAAFLFCRISGQWLISILFEDKYAAASEVFPYLFVAPIICMCFQLMGSQFLIIKKPIMSTLIAGIGVAINIALNYIGILNIGIQGAAMATVVSYCIIVIAAGCILSKRKMFKWSNKIFVPSAVFLMIILLDIFKQDYVYIAIASIAAFAYIVLAYYRDAVKMFRSLIALKK